MLRRWHVLLLILVTLTAFCGLAAAKLRATPKYDRIQVGMTSTEVGAVFGQDTDYSIITTEEPPWLVDVDIECDEGSVVVTFAVQRGLVDKVSAKSITRRGPLERLAWLAGWR